MAKPTFKRGTLWVPNDSEPQGGRIHMSTLVHGLSEQAKCHACGCDDCDCYETICAVTTGELLRRHYIVNEDGSIQKVIESVSSPETTPIYVPTYAPTYTPTYSPANITPIYVPSESPAFNPELLGACCDPQNYPEYCRVETQAECTGRSASFTIAQTCQDAGCGCNGADCTACPPPDWCTAAAGNCWGSLAGSPTTFNCYDLTTPDLTCCGA